MTAANQLQRLHAVVTGRVQGVGFRASTQAEARRLDLAGWVRNLWDGGVELEAEGAPATLQALLAFLRDGPGLAHVTDVRLAWLAPVGLPRPFEVRKTF
jgi:acylphosphatase